MIRKSITKRSAGSGGASASRMPMGGASSWICGRRASIMSRQNKAGDLFSSSTTPPPPYGCRRWTLLGGVCQAFGMQPGFVPAFAYQIR